MKDFILVKGKNVHYWMVEDAKVQITCRSSQA